MNPPNSAKLSTLLTFTMIGTGLLMPVFSLADHNTAHTIEQLQIQIASLMEQIKKLQVRQGDSSQWCYTFNNNLGIGSRGSAVSALQHALNLDLGERVEETGYFGEDTASAIKAFQEKYRDEILVPARLRNGNGYLGRLTRVKLNKLYGCGVTQTYPVPIGTPTLISTQPSITVLSPNGGEKLNRGNSYTISWNSVGNVGAIDIFLLKGNMVLGDIGFAGAYPTVPTSFIWKIADSYAEGSDYKIRVSNQKGTIWDDSDAPFSIVAGSQSGIDFTVENVSVLPGTVPVGGETTLTFEIFNRGTIPFIWSDLGRGVEWTVDYLSATNGYNNTARVLIDGCLSSPNNINPGNSCKVVMGVIFKEAGQKSFPIKANYASRVPEINTNNNSAPAGVLVSQPSITVTAPNGGEQWQKGSSQSVKWNSNNVPYVSVLLNKGQNTVKILADTIANQGFYQWNIPSDLLDGNDYRIRITQSGMPISLYDDSDAPFSIVAAVAPQKFSIADVQGYKTIYSAGEKLGLTVKGIEPDGTPTTPEEGFNVQVVVYNTATNAYVPQTNGNLGGNAQYSNGHWYFNANEALNAGDYYMIVYLYCAYDTKICATKYGRAAQVEKRFDFKVSSATQPSITVTWPQTGYSLDNSGGKDSGLIGNIQWTSSNTNNLPIEIDLLNNSGVIVKYIATYLTNTGSYAWKYDSSIPNGTYKIVVSTQAKEGTPGSAAGQSGYFTLSGAPTQPSITVTAPNGGEQWQKGSSQSVKWNSNNVPYVSVLLNKGQNTVKILADTIANQGFYQWNIPSDLLDGNDYRIRITQSGMPISLYDDSDAPFSITAPTGPADLSSGNQIFLSTVGVGQENILSFDVVNIGGSNFPLTYGSIWTYKDVSPIGEFSQRRIISDTCKLPTNSQLAPGNKCSVQIGVIFNSVGQKALSITLANDQNTQNNVFTITTNVQAVGGNGALVVSLDSSSPPHRIVVAGTTNVELARIKFSASGEAIDLRQVALQLSGTDFNTPNDLVSRRVKLWTADGVQIGEASFPTSDYAISTAIASGAFRVPAGGYKVLVIKGDISPVCISCAVTSPGDLLKVDWDGDNRGINGTYGIGINSGMNITPTGSDTASDGVTIVSATALTPSSSQTASVLDVIKPSWWPTGF